jgi:hypothetical protein
MISFASRRFRSSASERLPRFVETNSAENSPDALIDCRLRRVMSPPSGSILLDDLGALIGEKHRRQRPRDHAGQIEHSDTRQRTRHICVP